MKAYDRSLALYLYENRVSPTPEFSAAIDAACRQIRQSEGAKLANGTARRATRGHMPRKRRALVIVIAAVLLLLTACAAYAIYWSSTQKAKEYSESEQAVDDRLALAERSADAGIAGMTFYGAISGTAEVDGITLELKAACYWGNEDPPEMHVAFNAADMKTGDNSRLYDIDYVLTVGGKDYPAYAKADGTLRALPIIAQADPMAHDAEYEIWFRISDQEIVDGMPMTISGTLYSYDEDEQRGETLGSFSLGFVYEIPTEEIEAERQRRIALSLEYLDAEAQRKAEALSGLPDELTPLNITYDEYTFTDAGATEEGFVLGQTAVGRGSQGAVFYMDGYRWGGEEVSAIFTPDMDRPRQDISWEIEYYGTLESVTCYPWYAPVDELPETVLIAVLRDAGSDQRQKGSLTGIKEGEPVTMLTFTWEAIELLLRVNPRTGEITLPKDEAERTAWRTETERLAADGRNDEWMISLSGEQTVGGVTVRPLQMHVQTARRMAYIECKVDGLYYPCELKLCSMALYFDGTPLGTESADLLRQQYSFSQKHAQTWVDSYGGWQMHNGWFAGQGFDIERHPNFWPDAFTLRLVFEVNDRNEDWSLRPIGTFDILINVGPEDKVRGTSEEMYELII